MELVKISTLRILCDTHLHLDHEQFAPDLEQVLARATQESGVAFMINASCDLAGIDASIALAEKYDFIYAAIGWHPDHAEQVSLEQLKILREKAVHKKVVAIGEVGLDYYHEQIPREVQQRAFREQIAIAREVDLPLVIHARDSYQDVLAILRAERADEVGGVMHCFGGDLATMEEALQLGFMIGLGGIVTFKTQA